MSNITKLVKRKHEPQSLARAMCVLAVYYKAQRISNREFKLWTFLRGTESRVTSFLAETYLMSHQSLSRQDILYKLYNPIVTVFKYQFLQRVGVMKRLLLKLFSLIAIKRLTSALKQTVIARHSFRTV